MSGATGNLRRNRARGRRSASKYRDARPQPRANRNLTDFLFGQFTRDLWALKDVLKAIDQRRKELHGEVDDDSAVALGFLADVSLLQNRARLQITMTEFLVRIPLLLNHLDNIIADELAKGEETNRDRVANMAARIIEMFCRFCGAMAVVECSGVLKIPPRDPGPAGPHDSACSPPGDR